MTKRTLSFFLAIIAYSILYTQVPISYNRLVDSLILDSSSDKTPYNPAFDDRKLTQKSLFSFLLYAVLDRRGTYCKHLFWESCNLQNLKSSIGYVLRLQSSLFLREIFLYLLELQTLSLLFLVEVTFKR